MKNNKEAGSDSTAAELLKNGGHNLVDSARKLKMVSIGEGITTNLIKSLTAQMP
jgi:hypothetical protein